jgi:glycosyltransferase involved in cell wall biosynthesis
MGKAARKRAEMVYHWDRLVEQLMDIYEESLEANENV